MMSQTTTLTGYRIATRWTGEANDGYDASCYFDDGILATVYATAEAAEAAAEASYRGEDDFGVGLEFAAITLEEYGVQPDGFRPASRAAALDARLSYLASIRTYTYHEDGGHTESLDASTMDDACEQAAELCAGGDWGSDGASIAVYVTEHDRHGDETGRSDFTVEIEADRSSLIHDATGGAGCGDDHDDHDWTSEGEGGCDSNPGVWSTGGTGMSFGSHCRVCGLRCHEHHTGSQRNPGEHDTVSYEMPDGTE